MKIWLLKPRIKLPQENPWNPWYDKTFGVVVRAETEESARLIAGLGSKYEDMGDAWTNPNWSTCVELTPNGPEEVILSDVRKA